MGLPVKLDKSRGLSLSQIPMHECRGLCLASTAILVSLAGCQLWLQRPTLQGVLTRRPSLLSMPNKERSHRPRTFYLAAVSLPEPGACSVGKVPVGEPSLFSEEKCLSLHGTILSQEAISGNPVERHSSPGLKPGDSCRDYVECSSVARCLTAIVEGPITIESESA
jgi:hypothetical protein